MTLATRRVVDTPRNFQTTFSNYRIEFEIINDRMKARADPMFVYGLKFEPKSARRRHGRDPGALVPDLRTADTRNSH